MIGRRARGIFQSAVSNGTNGAGPTHPADDVILSVEKLTISFDGFTVLNELDFSMKFGEMRFLIGPNGAGKTTLIDAITASAHPGRLFHGARPTAPGHNCQVGIGAIQPLHFGSCRLPEPGGSPGVQKRVPACWCSAADSDAS